MKRLVILLVMLLLAACGSGTTPPPDDGIGAPTEAPPEPAEESVEEPAVEPTPGPPLMKLVVTGPEETVFDWSEEQCEFLHIPDIAARAFRDANDVVHLTVGHDVSYRMTGPDLNSVEIDCSAPIMQSANDPDPAVFTEGEWISATYTEDGQTIYALLHNEYRGHLVHLGFPEVCPSGLYLPCLDTSVTMAISTDGGATFQHIAEPPNHLVATLPVLYRDDALPTGVRGPSLIKGPDGYFYTYANISDYGGTPEAPESQRLCVMRTDNLADPSSWRYWDGSDFTGQWTNPYVDGEDLEAEPCTALEPFDMPEQIDGIVYNEVLDKYIAVGMAPHPTTTPDRLMWGVYYSFSDDLIEWSRRRLLHRAEIVHSVPNPETDLHYAYPTLLDPDSESRNFDTTDSAFYLYMTRANFGTQADRDLIRLPVELVPAAYDPPAWNFDTDGDFEGWFLENQMENAVVSGGLLTATTTGDDPYMWSPGFELIADDYSTVSFTMRVEGGDRTTAQLFFLTDTDAMPDEAKTGTVTILMDGEWHTYDMDMSGNAAWSGLITQIRLDVGEAADRNVEIDSIVIGP